MASETPKLPVKYLSMSPYVDMLIVILVLNSNSHFLNRPQVERVQICKWHIFLIKNICINIPNRNMNIQMTFFILSTFKM